MHQQWSTRNYFRTLIQPGTVFQSCIAKFTGATDQNLIIGKLSHIVIFLYTAEGLQQLIPEFPLYGNLSIFQVFRPPGDSRDSMFISLVSDTIVRRRYFILSWDAEEQNIVTRKLSIPDLDFEEYRMTKGYPADRSEIGIIHPEGKLLILHMRDGLLKVIPFDSEQNLKDAFCVRLWNEEQGNYQLLDIKFLNGYSTPTIAALLKGHQNCYLLTYEVSLERKVLEPGPVHMKILEHDVNVLISVDKPLDGIVIFGEKRIVYCTSVAHKSIAVGPDKITALGRLDTDAYLIADVAGKLHILNVIEETELKIEPLEGTTSRASTISCLPDKVVFVGSTSGDSQLVRLQSSAEGSRVELLAQHTNLGPISDFCVADLEGQGYSSIVTCSGSFMDSSLCVVRYGLQELQRAEHDPIVRMWSVRSSTNDSHDTFLILSFASESRVREFVEEELVDTEIEGFHCDRETLFCHDAVFDQFVQVTRSSLSLFTTTTKQRVREWSAKDGVTISVATANATQVILACGRSLVFLEIGDGLLIEIKYIELDFQVSCLEISPIGGNADKASLAAVGMSNYISDNTLQILSVPNLKCLHEKKYIDNDHHPGSLLFCEFEGTPHLLCGFRNGELVIFVVNAINGELTILKKLSLGTLPIVLCSFSSKGIKRVFAASSRAVVITSRFKKLQCNMLLREDIQGPMAICQFKFDGFQEWCLLMFEAEGEELVFAKLSDSDIPSHTIVMEENKGRRICHQGQSRTLATCGVSVHPADSFTVRFFNENLVEIANFQLDKCKRVIIKSFSFVNEVDHTYYLIGTMDTSARQTQGRILVYMVEENIPYFICEQDIPDGYIVSLNLHPNGNGVAATIVTDFGVIMNALFTWVPAEDGVDYGFSFQGYEPYFSSIHTSLLNLGFNLKDRSHKEYDVAWKLEALGDGISATFDTFGNIITSSGSGAVIHGLFHAGDNIKVIHPAAVARDSAGNEIPTVIFSTDNGGIGIIAALPEQTYIFCQNLELHMRGMMQRESDHVEWRSFHFYKGKIGAKNFIDGDLIESFLDLKPQEMHKVSTEMEMEVDELCRKVEELRSLSEKALWLI